MTKSGITVAIVGAGPAGLIAAQELSRYDGIDIHIFDAKPSVARKFLIAGRGGLNLTHSEPVASFSRKYEENSDRFQKYLERFSPDDLINWATALGINTFKGSSGRMFPDGMKTTPLLRAWLKSLDLKKIHFHLKHSWVRTENNNSLVFLTSEEESIEFKADAILYAMGGASYPHLGSDGSWVSPMAGNGVDIAPLEPSNCGFEVDWSDYLKSRFEGQPIKNITLTIDDRRSKGDLVLTGSGLEGGAIYALSRNLRLALKTMPKVNIELDLKPGSSEEEIHQQLLKPQGKNSFSNYLRKRLRLSPIKIALLYEFSGDTDMKDPAHLSKTIKALAVPVKGINNISRAISSAGGVKFENLDDALMLKNMPGIFFAGEMLDWEAPTGGYLLQGCFATGVVAADGIAAYLSLKQS